MSQDTVPAPPLSVDRPPIEALLVGAAEAGRLCGVSRSTFWALHAAGKAPRPLKLGRRTVGRIAELRAWVEAGCPPRERWHWEATR